MKELIIHKPCPSCRTENSVVIHKNTLVCTNNDCHFSVGYCCPLCDADLDKAVFSDDGRGPSFSCPQCKHKIPLQKIEYVIENAMVVDKNNRCAYCNGPTIHRSDMNLSHRCFFFPTCSGQVDLFGVAKESLVFLDFETTGLEAGRDHIIEIGALKIDEDGYEHTYQTFIKPPVDISAHITQITGITPEMVQDSPSLESVFSQFLAFIGSAKIVVHNADFDMLWLITSALKLNIDLQESEVICTLRWARQSGEAHCSLGALSKKYSIRHSNAHRALADAVATKELFFIFEGFKKSPRPQLSVKDFRAQSQKLVGKYAPVG
jgi:DNA polymerase III epsilon subunit family exonuclease